MAPLASQVLFAAGGDVLSKYGTLCWRKGLQTRGGEVPYTFTRTGNGLYLANDVALGGLKALTAGSGLARVEQLIDPVNGVLQNYLKLEPAATNSCLQSQALATAPWAPNVLTATNNTAVAPDGTTTATNLIPTAVSSNLHFDQQAITITSGENIAISGFFQATGYTGMRFRFADATSTNGFECSFNLLTGAFGSVLTGFGAGVLTGSALIALGGGWYWIGLWGKVNGGVTAGQMFIPVYDNVADANSQTAYTGDGVSGIRAWGIQVERNGVSNALPPSSYIATTTLAVTRNAEAFSVPFFIDPKAFGSAGGWMYLRFLERGGASYGTGRNTLAYIGGSLGSTVTFDINSNSGAGGKYRASYGIPTSVFSESQVGTSPVYGNVVELLAFLYPDGHVSLRQSIGGAGDTVGGVPAANGLVNPWGANTLFLSGASTPGVPTMLSRCVLGVGSPTTIADVRNTL